MSRHSISDEEKALFHEEMSTVKPLRQKNLAARTAKKPLKPNLTTQPSHREIPETQTPTLYLSDAYIHTVESETVLYYSSASLSSKRFRQLKQGEIARSERLDLHGLRPDDARLALCSFIQTQYNLGHRCVLVIHGKGGKHGETPILKNLVNHWLVQLSEVLAYHSARPRDGGNGALYVLLKRFS